MQPNPRDKARLDTLLDSTQRARSRRAWRIWIVIVLASVASIGLARADFVPSMLRYVMVAAGLLGLLGFVVFLSTKPYGRWDSSFWW
jgi:hypothetical protein